MRNEFGSSYLKVTSFLFVSSQEKYIDAASELIVYTYFFSASEDVVPEVIFKIGF